MYMHRRPQPIIYNCGTPTFHLAVNSTAEYVFFFFIMIFSYLSLNYTLVPVQYRQYEYKTNINIIILLDVLVCSIAEYFYELCRRYFDEPVGPVKI